MNIGIVGGRDFENYDLLKEKLYDFIDIRAVNVDTIVSGGAKGADSLAEKFAEDIGVQVMIFRPEYEKYGRRAPLERNTLIIKHSDVVFAFWDGKSRGTLDSITKAKKMDKELVIINF